MTTNTNTNTNTNTKQHQTPTPTTNKLISGFFMLIFALVTLVEMIKFDCYSHLTFWTLTLHCLTLLFTCMEHNLRHYFTMFSLVGAHFVLMAYSLVLLLNPTLENDPHANYKWTIFRTILIHGVPVLLFEYLATKQLIANWYSLVGYITVPIAHLTTGLIYEITTGKKTFNAYDIYLNNKNEAKITEPVFIICNLSIAGLVLYGTYFRFF